MDASGTGYSGESQDVWTSETASFSSFLQKKTHKVMKVYKEFEATPGIKKRLGNSFHCSR